jgi:hypothetical protein
MAREALAALAVAAFAMGTSAPGLLAAEPVAQFSWTPEDAACEARGPLRFCVQGDAVARGVHVDAFLENRGDGPLAGHLSAAVRDHHGRLVERLAEADLSLAAGVRLHLVWDQHDATGLPVKAGRYVLEAGFAGQRLHRGLSVA